MRCARESMAPTHCFVRLRLNATSQADAYESISADEFTFAVVDEKKFEEVQPGVWQIDIFFSYSGSEDVAEGDLEDDIAPEFRALMRAKSLSSAEFEFHIVVGGLHADPFELRPHVVAMISALGGSIVAHRSPEPQDNENAQQAEDGDTSQRPC